MGIFPAELAAQLRDRLGLVRAIETGAYKGDGLRALGLLFPAATSIEISADLAEVARRTTASLPNTEVVLGNSSQQLPRLVDGERPTLYWLDGHWSGGATGGRTDECPLLGELAATALGHPSDCILIDDARLFLAPPPPPHLPLRWPTFMQLYDTLRSDRPGHYITVAHDIVIAVPGEAKSVIDDFARTRVASGRLPFARRALARTLRSRLGR